MKPNNITNRHNAIAKCSKCQKLLYSAGGGLFRSCTCGSFIDQERFDGAYVRCGGDAEFIEQICPANCKYKKVHKDNKTILEFDKLQDYLKITYNLSI